MGHEIWNMRLIGHDDLAGFGNLGEGMAIQQAPDGRRILWLAHESFKDLTAVDVTDPRKPRVIIQSELPHPSMRSNSLSVVGDVMYVAHQAWERGVPGVGMDILDIRLPEEPRKIGHFDVSGPDSRGTHCLWCIDGEYAHLNTSMPDAKARNPKDDQFYAIVDVRDPTKPTEVGRWWLPGTMEDDAEPAVPRHPSIDAGYGMHNTNVYPRRPDRAYVAIKDGGAYILDISDKAHPREIGHFNYSPPFPGFTHTVLPLFDRELMVVTQEAIQPRGGDWPKLTWVMDMREETNIVPISTLPIPDTDEFFARPGRFGSHNIHENQPQETSFISEDLVFGTYFNGGIRVHDISNPFQPKEVAYFIPEWQEPKEPLKSMLPPVAKGASINDVYVDENRLVYAVDRWGGGLYVLEPEV